MTDPQTFAAQLDSRIAELEREMAEVSRSFGRTYEMAHAIADRRPDEFHSPQLIQKARELVSKMDEFAEAVA